MITTGIKNIGHCDNISSLVISPAQYAAFMIAIFDHWLELDDSEVEIRDIQSVVNLILGGNKRECIYMGQCDQFVTVYSDGSIYGCDSFPKTDNLCFGNVFDEPTVVRSKLGQIRGYKPSEICWKKEKSFVALVTGTLYVKEDVQRITADSLIPLNH